MAAEPQDFPLFARLPPELRTRVWQLTTAEDRVVEADMAPPADDLHTYCDTYHVTWQNNATPVVAHTCRAARQVALQLGGRLLLGCDVEGLRIPNADATETLNPWVWPHSTTVHINWRPNFGGDYELYENPISWFASHAARAGLRGLSVMASHALPWESGHMPPIHSGGRPFSSSTQKSFFQLVEKMAWREYTVCLEIVIVHISKKWLGSQAAPVLLVDATDHVKISGMKKLWQENVFDQQKEHEERGGTQGETDMQPGAQLQQMTADDFKSRVAVWNSELTRAWLWYKYMRLLGENQIGTIVAPAEIWTPPIDPHGVLMTGDLSGHSFSLVHPWVKATVQAMPIFRPCIMFRLCSRRCFDKRNAYNMLLKE